MIIKGSSQQGSSLSVENKFKEVDSQNKPKKDKTTDMIDYERYFEQVVSKR